MRIEDVRRALQGSMARVAWPTPRLDVVVRRARILRLKRYALSTAMGVIGLTGIAVPLWLLGGLGGRVVPSNPVTGPTSSPSSSPEPRFFVPPTRDENGKVTMTVVFPDGSVSDLVYRRELRLADLGISGADIAIDSFGESAPRPDCAQTLHVSYGDPRGSFYRGNQPLARYQAGGDTVELWRGVEGNRYSIVVRIGSWVVTLPCDEAPNETAQATWVRALRGTETEDGFMVLRPDPPLSLAKPSEVGGPSLYVGGPQASLSLTPGECRTTPGEGVEEVYGTLVGRFPGGASWCSDDGQVRVTAYGGDDFIEALLGGLELRNTRLAN